MKKKFITVTIFLFFIGFIYGQTKTETELWVKNKIETYQLQSQGDVHSYEVTFKKGVMILVSGNENFWLYDSIPLKDIHDISIVCGKDNTGKRDICTISFKSKYRGGGSYNKNEQGSTYYLYLNGGFKNENLPERMKKALKNLIVLNGGKFYKQKEAF